MPPCLKDMGVTWALEYIGAFRQSFPRPFWCVPVLKNVAWSRFIAAIGNDSLGPQDWTHLCGLCGQI